MTTFLLVLALAWGWIWSLTFWNRLYILMHREGYAREIFIVSSVVLDADGWHWAEGNINDNKERISLLGVLESDPRSEKDLQLAVPFSTEIEVLYNPSLTHLMLQGETPRVLPFADGFWESQRACAMDLGMKIFVPLLLAVIAKFVVVMRRSHSKSVNAGV